MSYETIDIARGSSQDEGIGIVTLNRPKVLNALNTQLMTELVDALQELDQKSVV